MVKTKEKGTAEVPGKNSQERRLRKIVQQTHMSLLIGITLLVLLGIACVCYVRASHEQLESTIYLNQYRLGSKTLTAAVQSYAVTGDTQYYDAYMQELNVDQNRDIALKGLETNNIRADEWEALNEIAGLSDGLVPLEEEAMEAVAAGDNASAIAFVFGQEYGNTIQKINSLTDETITEIQDRLEGAKRRYFLIQIVCALAFIVGFIRLAMQCMKTIKFSEEELLNPIIKVSRQMTELADGNLHAELDLTADDSEVGRMVSAIDFMKDNLAGIIEEISFVLEQMGQGNYHISVEQNYVGEYVQIKEALSAIVETMRHTVLSIKEVAGKVDCGAGQLATASEDLAIACTGQACQVSDLMILLSELSENIEYNEKEAEEAVKISKLSSSTLIDGNQKMTDLKQAMGEISACAEKIIAVVSAIADIGDEIDMVSLNASIESARAGEMGKGFAVVAEQVKKLAEESQAAVGRTDELIRKTVAAVALGTHAADEASLNMEEIQMGAEETTERLNRIVEKLTLEISDIEQINNGIGVVAGIVDNNSATSEETAAVSQEQKALAESMVQLMNRFRV